MVYNPTAVVVNWCAVSSPGPGCRIKKTRCYRYKPVWNAEDLVTWKALSLDVVFFFKKSYEILYSTNGAFGITTTFKMESVIVRTLHPLTHVPLY